MSNPEQLMAPQMSIMDRARYGAVLLLATGVAAFGASRVSEAVASDSVAHAANADAWPPIDQVIDGAEYGGNVGTEQLVADDCKEIGRYQFEDIRIHMKKGSRKTAVASYDQPPVEVCNGYGRRTIEMRVDTKKRGQDEFVKGDVKVVRSNLGADTTKKFELGQKCTSSTVGRLVTKISWEHLDGKVYKKTYRYDRAKLACR